MARMPADEPIFGRDAPDVAWRPTPEHLATSRLARFLRAAREPSLDALQRHAAADPAWFWGAAADDLGLAWDRLIDSYCLRFQLEFNFRDAKQFWGLEDFMNIQPTAVTNAANLALFMVNVSYRCLQDLRQTQPACSVLDLKAHCRGMKYVEETLKMLPEKPEPILWERIVAAIANLGRVHPVPRNPLAA